MKLITILSLLTTTIAAPTSSTGCFRLRSRTLASSNTSLFTNLYLNPYHIYPAFNYAVLTPSTPTNPGIIADFGPLHPEIGPGDGEIRFAFGDGGELQYGLIIDSLDTNFTYNPLEINAGEGTGAFFLDQGFVKVQDPSSGGFYGEFLISLLRL